MKKTFLYASIIGLCTLSACSNNSSETESEKEVKNLNPKQSSNEAMVDQPSENIEESINELKNSTEETKQELDELLNDL